MHGRRQQKGRGRGHGKRRRIMGFLQACILVQLSQGDRHGYDLLLGLQQFLHDASEYDPSIIYRILRDMEENGFVQTYESDVSLGPRRKMYRLLPEGKKQLAQWIDDLQRTKKEIETLLREYREVSVDQAG